MPRERLNRFVLLASILPACWLGMMLVHELGHVVGAWATGGEVQRLVFHPLALSRTDVSPNPSPLIVAWAGALVGCAVPAALLAAAWVVRLPSLFLWRFFCGFCFVANGLYLSVGLVGRVGDVGDLLRHGASAWQLVLFGAVTVPIGFGLWHGLGPSFGIGDSASAVRGSAAFGTLVVLILLVAGGLALGDGGG